MAYGKLKVPSFSEHDLKKTQKSYFDMVDETVGDAAASTRKINEANQSELSNAMTTALGEEYGQTWKKGMTSLGAMAEGKFTDEESSMFQDTYTARAQGLGLSGSGAGLNLTMKGMGSEMLRAKQQAISSMPAFMGGYKQAMVSTPMKMESIFTPITQYASQQAADNINAWRQQFASEQASHSASQASTAYNLQRQQAAAAQADTRRQQAFATQSAVQAQNAANYSAGIRNAEADRRARWNRRPKLGQSSYS